jgi:four helix bundle protein
MENKDILREKSFQFAVRIYKISKFLSEQKKEFIISKQVMRSGTSVGACIREARHGESKADFIHKLSIAQKEAEETHYWIELMQAVDLLNEKEFGSLECDVKEILKLITASIKTAKSNR